MSFNYKKNVRNLFIVLLAVFILIYIISILLLFFYRPLYTNAHYEVTTLINIKTNYLRQNREHRNSIFFASGSATQYGFSTEVFNSKLDYNVYNLATNAAFNLEFHLNFIREYAQKGDIIILPLEFQYIAGGGIYQGILDDYNYAQFSTWGQLPEYDFLIPETLKSQIITENLRKYWTRLPYLGNNFPIHSFATLFEITMKKGTLHKNFFLTEYGDALFDKPVTFDVQNDYHIPSSATDYFKDVMSNFVSEMSEKDIEVYFTYQPTVQNELFDITQPKTMQRLNSYEKIFEDLDFNFFGTRSFYNLPHHYFLDTEHHLNATGAVLRTLLMSEDINTYILGKESSYDLNSEEARELFIKQKSNEAHSIIEKWRKNGELLYSQK